MALADETAAEEPRRARQLFSVPDELWQRVRIAAVEDDLFIHEWVVAACEAALGSRLASRQRVPTGYAPSD